MARKREFGFTITPSGGTAIPCIFQWDKDGVEYDGEQYVCHDSATGVMEFTPTAADPGGCSFDYEFTEAAWGAINLLMYPVAGGGPAATTFTVTIPGHGSPAPTQAFTGYVVRNDPPPHSVDGAQLARCRIRISGPITTSNFGS
jgi:hypothetical protein